MMGRFSVVYWVGLDIGYISSGTNIKVDTVIVLLIFAVCCLCSFIKKDKDCNPCFPGLHGAQVVDAVVDGQDAGGVGHALLVAHFWVEDVWRRCWGR